MKWLTVLLDWVYPRRCVFCHRFLERGENDICPECEKNLPHAGSRGERHGHFFQICLSPLIYEEQVRESILRYKFGNCPGYAAAYGEVLAPLIREKLDGQYDILSWVPLSRRRLRQRGYDQAQLLAEAAARHLGQGVVRTLEKKRHVPRQSQAGSPEKRRANIAGAYRVPHPERVAGKRILIIDDVVTSAATLSECARTLRAAGAKEVLCATLACRAD